jgi:DNA-binding MarR family transcriptional regulator
MISNDVKNAAISAQLVARVGRLSQGEGFTCGLTTAQWTALRYFACANLASRTLSAFAEYHVTTRGTASQTVKGLVERGLLTRSRSRSDGRSVRFDLSEAGRVVFDQDPFNDLVQAINELPLGMQSSLQAALARVTFCLAHDNQRPPFGNCSSCHYLKTFLPNENLRSEYFCMLDSKPLKKSWLEKLCVNYAPMSQKPKKPAFKG